MDPVEIAVLLIESLINPPFTIEFMPPPSLTPETTGLITQEVLKGTSHYQQQAGVLISGVAQYAELSYHRASPGRDRSRSAWEVARVYAAGAVHSSVPEVIRQRCPPWVAYWIGQAGREDQGYTAQELHQAINAGIATIVKAAEPRLYQQLCSTRPMVDLRELTPLPPEPPSSRPAGARIPQGRYDPDYPHSHTYHSTLARRLKERDKDYHAAVEAWSAAIWLFPRFEYRADGLAALVCCVITSGGTPDCFAYASRSLEALKSHYRYLQKADPERWQRVETLEADIGKIRTRSQAREGGQECQRCWSRGLLRNQHRVEMMLF